MLISIPWFNTLSRIVLLALLLVNSGAAVATTILHTGRNTVIRENIDLANPKIMHIWNNERAGQQNITDSPYGNMSLLCKSSSSDEYGRCPGSTTLSTSGQTELVLRFTHTRDNRHISLKLKAFKKSCRYVGVTCLFVPIERPLNSSDPNGGYHGTSYSINIPKEELKKLTSPGEWKATLNMESLDTHKYLSWNANITLIIKGEPLILLPESQHSIDLKIPRATGNNQLVQGRNSLALCLYDGTDSADSKGMKLKFDDGGRDAPGRPTGKFSVFRSNGKANDSRDRLDYSILMKNLPSTGSITTINNGVDIILRAQGKFPTTIQTIEGIQVSCVPTTLELTTQFILGDKNAGNYNGVLNITYEPQT